MKSIGGEKSVELTYCGLVLSLVQEPDKPELELDEEECGCGGESEAIG